jgi:AcrR family transcriptional regulator
MHLLAAYSAATVEPEPSTRQRLLAAASEVFLEQGYQGTRVQDVAKRAGLTTGAIYANFDSKAALLAEAVSLQALQGQRYLEEATSVDELPRDVAVNVHASLLSGPAEPVHRVFLEAWAAAMHDADAAARVRDILDQQLALIDFQIGRGRELGRLDPDVDDLAMRTLSFALFVGGNVIKAFDLPRPEPDVMAALLRRLYRNLTAPGVD